MSKHARDDENDTFQNKRIKYDLEDFSDIELIELLTNELIKWDNLPVSVKDRLNNLIINLNHPYV